MEYMKRRFKQIFFLLTFNCFAKHLPDNETFGRAGHVFNFIRYLATFYVINHPKGVRYRIKSKAEFSPFKVTFRGKGVIGRKFTLLGSGNLSLGNNNMMAPEVTIVTSDHKRIGSTHVDGEDIGNVVIGNKVWIGTRVIVLKGVTIGDNVIIGAGSVVTKSFPSNCVIAGNPAKIVKSFT